MSEEMPDFSNVRSGSSSTAPKVYVVKSGDSLSKIAKAEYGNASDWNRIFGDSKDSNEKLANARVKTGRKTRR